MKDFLKEKITRREFLKRLILGSLAVGFSYYFLKNLLTRNFLTGLFVKEKKKKLWKWSKEAYFYIKIGNLVQCQTCPNRCLLREGERGRCRTKINFNGKLYTIAYGNPCAVHIDPIEKKPLFHFLPGTKTFSIATAGCNFRCLNCFPPDTFIPTDRGLLKIEDLCKDAEFKELKSDGCEVYTINHVTYAHDGSKRKILHVFRHPYVGDLLVIKPFYLPPLICTPYHEIFVYENGKIRKAEARFITNKHFLLVPKLDRIRGKTIILDLRKILPKWIGKFKIRRKYTIETVKRILQLKKKGYTSAKIGRILKINPSYVRKLLALIRKGEKFSLVKKVKLVEKNGKIKYLCEKRPFIKRFIKLDERLAQLFGYYCAEGCVHKYKNRKSFSLLFSFGKKEKNLVEKVRRLVKEVFGIDPKIKETKTSIVVRVGKTTIALLFKELCGTNAVTKKVPYILFQARKNIIKAFLNAYLEGDGYVKSNIISSNTVSKQLALGIYFLFLRLGIIPSFYEVRQKKFKTIEGRIVKQSPSLYYVKLSSKGMIKKFTSGDCSLPRLIKETKNFYLVPVKDIMKIKYKGYVYNLEVKEKHSYLANFIGVGNCQNWTISQVRPEDTLNFDLPPEAVVREAKKWKCESIAYTYSEPVAFYEYMFDTAKLAKQNGIKNLWITNGYINEKPLRELCKYIDAANVDLKNFKEEIYERLNGGSLKPVLRTLKILKEEGVWFEVTNLVIPNWTDDLEMIREMCKWLVKNIGRDYPLHFSRFFPHYKLKHLPPTPIKTLEEARKIALEEGLKFVYIGNVPLHPAQNTYCPNCGRLLIERKGYKVTQFNIVNDSCKFCGEKIAGVWKL